MGGNWSASYGEGQRGLGKREEPDAPALLHTVHFLHTAKPVSMTVTIMVII